MYTGMSVVVPVFSVLQTYFLIFEHMKFTRMSGNEYHR